MAAPATLSAQQGLAYVVAAHGVLQRQSVRTTCPVAQLQTLLALHTLNESASYLYASTGQLGKVMQLQLPLLRGYVRELVTRRYVEYVRFYKRGPRLLKLTGEGQTVARGCQIALKRGAGQVLTWQEIA
jgi:hypothetical protein